ncbi:MAG: hypothetical protein JRJ47_00185 [Deltaproteobacteria bacterium]|nr:hypothetical protein [Deltaproteobacteria bacterium]
MSQTETTILYRPKGLCFWKPRTKYAEGLLLDGKRHGRWLFWYKNRQKQLEGEYSNGEKTGLWIKWDECGTKIVEGHFLYGKMHGKWTDWYVNGQKAQESHWYFGKRDGKWTSWNVHGTQEKVVDYDHRHEQDRGYSLHTDFEAREMVRQIQKGRHQRSWERLVGRFVAGLVKPWHIACWILVFLLAFGLIPARTQWRGLGLAAIIAFFLTTLAVWTFDKKQ